MIKRIVSQAYSILTFAKVMEHCGSQYLDLRSLFYFVLLVVRRSISLTIVFCSTSLLFAQQPPPAPPPPNNTITLITYYPAPFGAYKKLTVSDNVGIGTTSPGARLSILTAGVAQPGIQLVHDAVNGGDFTINPFIFNNSNNGLEIVDNTAGQRRLVIDSTGNVGIGTTGPGNLLEVVGTTGFQTKFRTTANSTAGLILANSAYSYSINTFGSVSNTFEIQDVTAGNLTSTPFRK